MSPIGEKWGPGFLSAFIEDGKPINMYHGDGVNVELLGTADGGHVKLVEKGETKLDVDLGPGEYASHMSEKGEIFQYAGGNNREEVEAVFADVVDFNLPAVD